MSEHPTGTVTFLFTDIEGSTRLWEKHPEAMQGALARHDRIVRSAIETNGGYIFATGGDGFAAAFHAADAAAVAASLAQRELDAEVFPGDIDLLVRMGIHTGTADERNGDYFGPTVNAAARVMGAVAGRQVALSDETAALLRKQETVDQGAGRLRDLEEPVRIHLLVAEGLDSSTPPVTLDDQRTNLPIQLTSFVGRDDDIRQLGELLATERLITLTGVGGVGKTRLALQAAARHVEAFPDGAWLCELAPVSDPEAVVHALATAIGVAQLPNKTLAESIVDVTRRKRLLVILDNCEHLLGPVAVLVDQLLRGCPELTILATSREPIAAAGEHVMPVRSLTTDGAAADAVRLFLDRAQRVSSAAGHDPVVVARICDRLDGIPLALELAAARTRSLGLDDIEARLDERFRLLRGSRRTASERHQTLQAAVEWSYDLLTDDERFVFDRLSVFAGGFDATAAAAVVDGDYEEWELVDILEALTDRSMVHVDTSSGSSWYGLLETLRQFGQSQLTETGEADRVRDRHLRHYLSLIAELDLLLRGPDEAAGVRRFHRVFDNVRAAFWHAFDTEQFDAALAIVDDTFEYANWRGRFEIVEWADELTAHPELEEKPLIDGVFNTLARGRWAAGDLDGALEISSRGLRILAGRGQTTRHYLPLIHAVLAAGRDDVDFEAERAAVTSFCAAAAEEGDLHREATALSILTALQYLRGEDAHDLAAAAMERAEAHGGPTVRALALFQAGYASLDAEQAELAAEHWGRIVELADEVDNWFFRASTPGMEAKAALEIGNVLGAAALCRASLDQWSQVTDEFNLAITLAISAEVLAALGQVDDAARIVGAITTSAFGGPQLAVVGLPDIHAELADTLGARLEPLEREGSALGLAAIIDVAMACLDAAAPPEHGDD